MLGFQSKRGLHFVFFTLENFLAVITSESSQFYSAQLLIFILVKLKIIIRILYEVYSEYSSFRPFSKSDSVLPLFINDNVCHDKYLKIKLNQKQIHQGK